MQEKISFFDMRWIQESPRIDTQFGINDGDAHAERNEEKRAFTTTEGDQQRWNALVTNDHATELQFTPIDHNLPEEGLCDGLLYATNRDCLFFIELKTGEKRWIPRGIMQLEKSISLFKSLHKLKEFKLIRAYLCNNSHPHFQSSKREEMQRFRDKNGVRLIIQREIVVNKF